MIGELPLNQLANFAKESFSLSVSLWLRRLQLEHGDDYCTSWYEMKEVLRRQYAPPLEPKKNILSSSGSSYVVASEFFCATQFEKNASTNHPAIMGLPSDLPAAASIVGADVPVNASVSDFLHLCSKFVTILVMQHIMNHLQNLKMMLWMVYL
jgi:hypothetical protein